MIDYSLVEEENKYIVQSSGLSIRRQSLYPSESSVEYTINGIKIVKGKCLRAVYWRATGEPQSDPGGPHLMMTAHLGKAAEEYTVNKFKEMGIWVDNNIKFFDPEIILSGELDIVIKVGDKKIGIEQKSMYGPHAEKEVMGMKGRQKKDGTFSDKQPRIYGKPKFDQFLQAVRYSHKYVNELKLLDEFRMYYIDRGDGKRVEFVVGTDLQDDGTHKCWYEQVSGPYWNAFQEGKVYLPFTIEDINNRTKTVLSYIRKKELPPRDYEYNPSDEYVEFLFNISDISKSKYDKHISGKEKYHPWVCDYCKYKTKCLALDK